jgi:AcrR family transcriptional regulator
MRRTATLDIGALGAAPPPDDVVADRILDAAAAVLAARGLRRCTVEDIAEAGGVGRTTVYRRFDGRDAIVQAVLAREVRRTFAAVNASVAGVAGVEDKLVEGMLTAIRAFHRSPLLGLVRTEPDLLALVTTHAGPLTALAVDVLVDLWRRDTGRRPTAMARQVAEVLVRLGMSYALAPPVGFDLDDDRAARRALRAIVGPLVGGGT